MSRVLDEAAKIMAIEDKAARHTIFMGWWALLPEDEREELAAFASALRQRLGLGPGEVVSIQDGSQARQ